MRIQQEIQTLLWEVIDATRNANIKTIGLSFVIHHSELLLSIRGKRTVNYHQHKADGLFLTLSSRNIWHIDTMPALSFGMFRQ
jgi:hypothetical protein